MFPFDEDGPTDAEMAAAAEQCAADRERQVDAVKAAIAENACECFDRMGQYMLGRIVVVVEVIDEAGFQNLVVLSPDEQPVWDDLGLLTFAASERA